MKRKRLILSLLAGAAVGGAAVYFLATKSGKAEWQRLKKTGKATADTFKTFGDEVVRNAKQERKQERARVLKDSVRAALEI